eukprot:UN00186
MSEEQRPQEKPWKDGPASATSGYVGWLTPQEEETLQKMKDQLTEKSIQWEDDYELLRFLRARKFVLADAVTMFEKFKQWYAENHIYKYPDEFPAKAAALGDLVPSAYIGFDKEGHPIQIEKTGSVDVPTLLSAASDQTILLGWIWGQQLQIKRCAEGAEKRGLPKGAVERFTQIMDLEGLSMSHGQMSKFLSSITKCGEANYPERLARTLVVNYGLVFTIIWNMVKFTLDPVTREKIIPCSTKEELLKYIDKSELPQCYGGDLPDPDSLKIRDTNELRKKYLNDDKYKNLYETITVVKDWVKEVPVALGHELAYCFRCDEPIDFQAKFIPEGVTDPKDYIDVSNPAKVDCVEWPSLGSFSITNDKPGKVVFTFTNTNWVGNKQLKFACVDIDTTKAE